MAIFAFVVPCQHNALYEIEFVRIYSFAIDFISMLIAFPSQQMKYSLNYT